MEASNFTNPLESLEIFTLFFLVKTLGGILVDEKLLTEKDKDDKYKIAQSLFQFLDKYENNSDKKITLIKNVLNGTDLYGAKENEILDNNFVNFMYEHIITTLFFNTTFSPHAFIAHIILFTDDSSMHNILQTLINISISSFHITDTFDLSAKVNVLNYIFLPLLPLPNNKIKIDDSIDYSGILEYILPREEDFSIFSIDYIYALAGSMFVRSNKLNLNKYLDLNMSNTNNTNNNNIADVNMFNQYVRIGHLVEILVLNGELNKSALIIFAFPAFLYYIYTEREHLRSNNIMDLITDENHWVKAYELLFSYMQLTYDQIKDIIQSDPKFQYHYTLSLFKNRTTMAKEEIQKYCSFDKKDIDKEVTNYKNNPKEYKCQNGKEVKLLPNINEMFDQSIENMQHKYYLFEIEIIKEAFGDTFIRSMNSLQVEIRTLKPIPLKNKKNLMPFYFNIELLINSLIDKSESSSNSMDYLEIHFLLNLTKVIYALEQKDDVVYLHKLHTNTEPYYFNFIETFFNNEFVVNDVFSDVYTNFSEYLNAIVTKKAENFKKNLYLAEYDQTEKEWWTDFGLSLIPFYSCITGIIHGDGLNAAISCSLDALLFIPIVGEATNVVAKITTSVTRSFFKAVGTTVMESSTRLWIDEILTVEADTFLKIAATEFSETVLVKETFKSLGIATLRFIDPGFELIYLLGKGGLRLIGRVIDVIEKKIPNAFKYVKEILKTAESAITSVPKKIGRKFNKDVYVRSFDSTRNSGYGYKFTYLSDGKIAEIRNVPELNREVAVILYQKDEFQKIYKEIDVQSESTKGDYLHLLKDTVTLQVSVPYHFRIPSHEEWTFCHPLKSKRSPNVCDRIIMFSENTLRQVSAIKESNIEQKFAMWQVIKELEKYLFPSDQEEQRFLNEWASSEILETPLWAEQYRIEEPEILFCLRNKMLIDTKSLTIEEGEMRINQLYSEYVLDIIGNRWNLVDQFNSLKAYEVMKYEDFYAMDIYKGNVDSGNLREIIELRKEILSDDSIISRRLHNALLRIAIRQYDQPIEKFAKTLYSFELINTNDLNEMSVGTQFNLGNSLFFAMTSEKKAMKVFNSQHNDDKILSKIVFAGRYLRANLDIFGEGVEECYLLPHSEFKFKSIKLNNEKKYTVVTLEYVHKESWKELKEAMAQIKNLLDSGIQFYHDIPPRNPT